MEHKDAVIAIFGAGVGLAGIVLVFIGFVSTHAENFQNNNRKRIFKLIAKIGLAPFSLAILSAFFSLLWLNGPADYSYHLADWLLRFSLGSTLLYGIISVMFFL